MGRAFGIEADAAAIQSFADHVLRKESRLSSRFTSFSEEVSIARKFTKATDNRLLHKVNRKTLEALQSSGIIKLWHPEQIYHAMLSSPRKIAKQAGDVLAAMVKNCEILIEGQIPSGVMERVH